VSLFFRARARTTALVIERGSGDPLERALAALIGLATRGSRSASRCCRALLARGGLLAAAGTGDRAQLLSSVFSMAVRRAVRPGRYEVAEADQTRLGSRTRGSAGT
jgi:predicted component of type VI protein secretion system